MFNAAVVTVTSPLLGPASTEPSLTLPPVLASVISLLSLSVFVELTATAVSKPAATTSIAPFAGKPDGQHHAPKPSSKMLPMVEAAAT